MTLPLTNRVPDGTTGVIMNVTAVEQSEASHLTVYPAGEARPSTSNLNLVPGRTLANLVTVALGNDGLEIYNLAGAVHVIADLAGYFYPT